MTYFVPAKIQIEAKSEEEAFERVPAERELSSESLLKPAEEVWGQG